VSKANIHPHHLRKSGGKVKKFGGTVKETGQKLEQTGQNLVEHASGDRSGVGSVVAKFTGKATEIAGKVFSQGGRVAEEAGDRLGKTADLYEEADTTAAKSLRKHHPDSKRKVDPPGGSKRSGSPVGKGGGSAKKPKRVPGGGTHQAEKVGGRSGGKDHKVPTIPGGGGDPTRLKGRLLPDPNSAEGQLPGMLERHGMTREEFDSLRHRMNQPGGTANVTHEEAMKWRNLREDIPLEAGMPVQKVLNPQAVENYLGKVQNDDFNYERVQGCFARSVDASQLTTPAANYRALALNYPGTPFSDDMESVYVLKSTVSDPGNYEIPFGGTTREGMENIEGTRLWKEPFNGNGVTRSDDYFVPEWERMPSDLGNGDRIVRIDITGQEYPVATFHKKAGWVPTEKG
jgi:hypothetical protein